MIKVIQEKHNTFVVIGHDYNTDSMLDLIQQISTMAKWCKEVFENAYETWNIDHTGCRFIFQNTEDAMAFKLRWMQ